MVLMSIMKRYDILLMLCTFIEFFTTGAKIYLFYLGGSGVARRCKDMCLSSRFMK